MKSNNNETMITIKLEDKIENPIRVEHAEFEIEAAELGGRLAENNRPRLEGDTLNPYIQVLAGKYLSLFGNAKKLLQTGLEERMNEEDLIYVEAHKKKNNHQISELKHELHIHKVELERTVSDVSKKKYKIVLCFLAGIAFSEAIIDYRALQNLGGNAIEALLIGIALGLSTAVISHEGPKLIRKGRTRSQQIGIFLLITLLMTTVFFIIGTFRMGSISNGLNIGVESSSGGASPIQFAIINLMFFAGALLLAYFQLPQRTDELKWEKQSKHESEIKKLIQEIKAKEDENKKLDYELKEMARARQQNLLYEQKLKEWIASLFQKSVSRLISENTIKRTDGIPDCFNGELPQLFND
jgi:hypothetical protein